MYNSLRKLFGSFINDVKEGLVKDKDIKDRARQFIESEEVDRYLNNLMSRMTARIRIDTAREMRKSATAGTNSALLFELMKHEMDGPVGRRVYEIIADNVQYIKTVPQFWADYIVHYAQREALRGKRPEVIEAELRKVMPQHMAKNLKTIARTECAKANAAITQARAEAVGIRCYIWRTVKDERVRASHRAMDGKVVFYSSPPNPEAIANNNGVSKEKPYGAYHAGNTFNCRCWQQVIFDERYMPSSFDYCMGDQETFTNKIAFLKRFGKIT